MALGERELYACYQRLERPLFDVLYRMLWNTHECEDLMQDAFLRVWRRRKLVAESSLDSLIWVAALNLARNRLRWRRLWRSEAFDAEWPDDQGLTPEESANRLTQQRRVHDALERLPAAMREVVLLSKFAELSHGQIATLLRIPSGTVASRLHQAIGRLHTLLSGDRND